MYCWICANEAKEFLAYGVPARPGRCPNCGGKPRSRVLGWLLREVLCPRLPRGARLLEGGASKFSVERLLTTRFLGRSSCTVIDIRKLSYHTRLRRPRCFVQMDLTRMGFCDDSFDLILCNNTLPYVSNDRGALAEIRRCLKPRGIAIINTHREPGPTIAAAEHHKIHPELGDEFYAANGDQWVYGDDFFDRVTEAGLSFAVATVFKRRSDEFLRNNGLKRRNEIIFAFTDPSALEPYRHPDVEMA